MARLTEINRKQVKRNVTHILEIKKQLGQSTEGVEIDEEDIEPPTMGGKKSADSLPGLPEIGSVDGIMRYLRDLDKSLKVKAD